MSSSDDQLSEYERRSTLQDDMLRPAYRRVEHRAHIERHLKHANDVRGHSGNEPPRESSGGEPAA